MSWSNVCVEGFCSGGKDGNGNYPCGRYSPSHLCLENGMCPLFGYAEVFEREVARFPKLYLILWDRLGIWGEGICWKLRWWLWDCLWFNRQKIDKFFKDIESVSAEDCPAIAEFEAEEETNKLKFRDWFNHIND